jgi:hypothetical protein
VESDGLGAAIHNLISKFHICNSIRFTDIISGRLMVIRVILLKLATIYFIFLKSIINNFVNKYLLINLNSSIVSSYTMLHVKSAG